MYVNIALSVSIIILLILSCLFSGNETAITNLKPYQWKASQQSLKHKIRNKCVLTMLNNYSISLGSILIGNTISNIVCSSLVTLIVEKNFDNIYVALATGILAFFVLVFCEYLPKSIARKHSIGWIVSMWWFIIAFYYLFWPFCWIFNLIFEKDKQPTASERDINYLVRTIQKEGVLEQDEASLVNNALRFDDVAISTIMIKKFIFINNDESFEEIKNKFIKSNYSRIPVLNSKQKAIGFLMNKDILKEYAINTDHSSFKINKHLKHLHTVLENSKLDDVLRVMQQTNSHIVGIVKTKKNRELLGIVTMEMIIEQLVGQIYDEKDKIYDVQAINSFTWIVDPDVNASKFLNKYLNINIPNKNITLETYLKKVFKFKHNERYAKYENNKFLVNIVKSQIGNQLKYEITKK